MSQLSTNMEQRSVYVKHVISDIQIYAFKHRNVYTVYIYFITCSFQGMPVVVNKLINVTASDISQFLLKYS